ncbi:MAG TPA: DUF4395 domain-containing protein [Acidimicrobiales bacterium]|nr:DUF4395 domain-containing protein [Acidimicrobiales bacterium]
MTSIVGFPDPVNEVSARVVASGVVVLCLATIALDQPWLTAVIAYGFVARVVTGPTLSPLGQLATRVVTPRLGAEPRYVPGPPKRFAQAIGAVLSVTASVLALGLGLPGAGYAVLGALAVAAGLEAALGLCLGCQIFAILMRVGLIPREACERCADLGWPGRGDTRRVTRTAG